MRNKRKNIYNEEREAWKDSVNLGNKQQRKHGQCKC